MTNAYYTSPTDVEAGVKVRSVDINTIDAAIDTAFDKLPTEATLKRGTVNYAVDTGTANTYLVALPHTPSGYVDGLTVRFRALNTNTGAATINVSSLGVKSIRNRSGSALAAGDITVGVPLEVIYSTATGFFHLSENSAVSATAAASSATAAASSASSASSSASAASSSATAAASSASAASTSETNAASSASSASTSASTATTQASNASTSATNAANSATTAGTHASNASTSATNAASSASSASTSASTATTQASNASTSATNAATSATSAAGSATSAATSATNAATSASEAAASAASIAGGPVTSVNSRTGVVTGLVDTGVITGSGLTMNTAKLLGRTTASAGAIEEISVSGGTLSGGSLTILSGISTVGATVTGDYTIASATPTIWPCATTAIGKCLTAPAADGAGMTKGLFAIIDNSAGGYPVGFRDSAGTLRGAAVAAGGIAHVYLEDTSTAAGTWRVTGTNLEPGLIGIDNTFSSTYAATVLKPFVALDDNKSIHFLALANGFAAVAVDKTTGAAGTPLTITTTASSVPKHCFKITSTTAIVFYAESNDILRAAVITLSGATTLAVGTEDDSGAATGIGVEDFSGAHKIAQLDSTHYLVSWATATGAGNTSVMAIEVTSGTTVTFGAKADIITANNVQNSTTTYALTATTGLVIYADDAASPYTLKAVVITVSGTTCTVETAGTATIANIAAYAPPFSCRLSATKVLIAADNNTANMYAYALTIAGTAVSVGAACDVETYTGVSMVYTASSATRYNPHLWRISDSSAGLWYLDGSNISRAVVLSESGGTVTAGTKLYRSISAGAAGDADYGIILPQGTSEICMITQAVATTAGANNTIVTSKIDGTTITQGGSAESYLPPINTQNIDAIRLSSGKYAVIGGATATGFPHIPVWSSNGDVINYLGEIKCPLLRTTVVRMNAAVSSNRFIALGATYRGTTVGATTYQLRLLSVEICQ